jgi:hypothetical protein
VREFEPHVNAARPNQRVAQPLDVVGSHEQQAPFLGSDAVHRIEQPCHVGAKSCYNVKTTAAACVAVD